MSSASPPDPLPGVLPLDLHGGSAPSSLYRLALKTLAVDLPPSSSCQIGKKFEITKTDIKYSFTMLFVTYNRL